VFPAVFAYLRVSGAGADVSLSDLVLVVTTIVALPYVPWRSRTLRRILLTIAVYQLLMLVTVAAAPDARALFEWLHRASLLGGSFVVGAAVANLGRSRHAVSMFLLVGAVVAVVAVGTTLTNGFAPAYPLGMGKNHAGGLLAMALAVTFTGPRPLLPSRRLLGPLRMVLFAGILASQSRGAMTALVVGLVLWAVLARPKMLRSPLLVLGALTVTMTMAVVVTLSIQAESRQPDTPYSAISSRRIANEAAKAVWEEHPLFGAGLRYFRAPGYQLNVPGLSGFNIEVHNVVYSTLAESGLIGLVALTVLLGRAITILGRLRTELAASAIVLLSMKFVHGMVDIYWVAGTQTLPWLFVGLAVGTISRGREEEDAPSNSSSDIAEFAPRAPLDR
jgi:hypothetical protein